MSAQAFNRIAALEAEVKALIERIEQLEKKACEARPSASTLSLKQKANTSHA
jgi:hypothetical protein